MYMSVALPAMNAMAKIPVLLSSRLIYFREKNSAMYSPIAYYTGRVLGDQPYIIAETLIYTNIIYWTAGMRTDVAGSHYGLYVLCFFLVRSTGFAFVEFFGALAPSGEAAISGVGSVFTMFQLFTGFLIRKSAIPRGWIWMHWLSLFKYPVSFMIANELSGLEFSCPNNNGAVSLPFDSSTDIAHIVSISNGAVYCTGFNNTMPCYACPTTTGKHRHCTCCCYNCSCRRAHVQYR
jgi:ABC-type multidrug transport system permease subunit